ncbi:MAG: hypothetical protein OSB55_09050, partial [Verrucomicrobiota bacterium]|nr:hypothetical protein [Verrucomicrobiota bacterium]
MDDVRIATGVTEAGVTIGTSRIVVLCTRFRIARTRSTTGVTEAGVTIGTSRIVVLCTRFRIARTRSTT